MSSTVSFRVVQPASSWRRSRIACAFFSVVSINPITACSDCRANAARAAKEPPPSSSRRSITMSCAALAEDSARVVTFASHLVAVAVRPAKVLIVGSSVVTVSCLKIVILSAVSRRNKLIAVLSASVVSRRSKRSASPVSILSEVTSARRAPRVDNICWRVRSSCRLWSSFMSDKIRSIKRAPSSNNPLKRRVVGSVGASGP